MILVEINITSTVGVFGITQKMDVLQIMKLKVLSKFSVSGGAHPQFPGPAPAVANSMEVTYFSARL